MKTKKYRNGKFTCTAFTRKAGLGWEVGFNFGTKTIFVGNFVNATEAKAWWTLMNREITNFSRKYRVTNKFPKSHYAHFLSSHLNATYYSFLDKLFAKNKRTWGRQVTRGRKTFQRLNKKSAPRERAPFLRAA